MLIEQIFKLRELGPPGGICTPMSGCFCGKTIMSQESNRLDCYLQLKDSRRQCTLLPPTWAKSFTKFKPKMYGFKCAFDLNCKQKED